MGNNKEDFIEKILETFKIEAEESINSVSSDLIALEKETNKEERANLIEVIYRNAHSLKGAARAVNLSDVEGLCHAFEGVMSAIRKDKIELLPEFFDSLHKTVSIVSEVLNNTDNNDYAECVADHIELLNSIENGIVTDELITNKEKKKKEEAKERQETEIRPEKLKNELCSANSFDYQSSTVRVSTDRLDKFLLQVEEMLEIKLASVHRKDEMLKMVEKFNIWDKEFDNNFLVSDRLKNLLKEHKLNSLVETNVMKLVNFMEQTSLFVRDIRDDINILLNTFYDDIYSNSSKIDNLLEDVKDLITVPFSQLLSVFPQMIRSISKELNKEVEFEVTGEHIEVDRRVLEKIKNPIIHIIRNAITYGVESHKERIKKGKNIKGCIKLNIDRTEGNKVLVEITDDGAGIDFDKIRSLYMRNHVKKNLKPSEITDDDCIAYIFRSGISTNEMVTDISGRGLGLAVVQDSVEQLGGVVEVKTEKDKYTTFRLILPLSLVTYRGVLFEISDKKYVIPTSKVDRAVQLEKKDIKIVNGKLVFYYDGELIPLISLNQIFGIKGESEQNGRVNIIVAGEKNKKFGLIIKRLICEQEVLVKKFDKQLSRVKFFSGATVLGSGEVVPIINLSDIYKKAIDNMEYTERADEQDGKEEEKIKSILVVEDSVTSRMLIKNILESSGYKVETAIDGIDGYTKLKEHNFDAVVSDIEMPRMNGFELTEKIRREEKNKDIPVVLVTSLSKREDKERGMDAGANAYVMKSSFDHSNLLEILDRLI